MIRLKRIDHTRSMGDREHFLQLIQKDLPPRRVVLSTCGRVELYEETEGQNNRETLFPIVHHLFRVAAGLESVILGENQILAQVKESYEVSLKARSTGKELNVLFQSAIRLGKQVRTNTGISKGAISHAQAAAELIRKDDPAGKTILIIGVNHLNRSIIRYLVKHGLKAILLGNRTYESACAMAREFHCEAFPLTSLREMLPKADILVSATSAPHRIVQMKDYPVGKSMTIYDLAAPPDVDEEIAGLSTVRYLSIGDIEVTIEKASGRRLLEAVKASEIVYEEACKTVCEFERRSVCYH